MAQNLVQYTVNLNGNATKGMTQLDQATQKVTSSINMCQSKFQKIGDTITRINNIYAAAATAVGKLQSAMSKLIDTGAENELQKMNMTTLFRGNAQAAQDMFDKITQYGKATVYDKAGLIEAQKTMMSFGVSAEQSYNTLRQIGDIAMGDSQKMQSLALAFAQATSAGKLQGQDLMQLINAGFNPLQTISERTGQSIATLKEQMAQGKISADMLAQAFQWATDQQGLFYQGAEKAGTTTIGRINQLKDTFDEFIISAYEQLKPLIDQAIQIATNILEQAPQMLQQINSKIKNTIDFIDRFKPIIIGIAAAIAILTFTINATTIATHAMAAAATIARTATTLWTGAQAILNAIMTANPIGLVIAGIAALVGAIVWVCSHITGWGSLWDGVCGFMKYTFYAFVDGVKLYFNTLINGIMIGLDKIKLAWYKFKEACGIGNTAENQAAIAQINADVERRQQEIINSAKAVQENALKAQQSLAGINMGWKGKDKTEQAQASLGTNQQLRQAVNATSTNNYANTSREANKSAEAVATGGTRNTNIHINIQDMIRQVVFNGTTQENLQEIQNNIAQTLLQVLNMAQASVS